MPTTIIPIPKARDAANRVNQPVRIDPGETPTRITNPSNVTVYYKSTDTVSDTSNDGTLTQGQTLSLTTTEYLLGAERTEVVLDVVPPLGDRRRVLDQGLGLVAQTFDQSLCSTATALVGGTVYVYAVGLRAGDVISSISTTMTTNGATLTLTKVGLYDASRNRLALSADNTTAFTAGAPKVVTTALTAPYTVPADGLYYAAIIAVGTTGPTVGRTPNGSFDLVAVGANPLPGGRQAGQSDLPATLTLSGSGPYFWLGLS